MSTTRRKVAVFDYGSGNVHSVQHALTAIGVEAVVTRDPELTAHADGLVVPGVGAFDAVMRQLRELRGEELIARRLAAHAAVLGICVGAQIMFERGVEHGIESAGLGRWPGTVRQLHAPRLPHMGWNTVNAATGSTLFAGIEHERFYFVHSYAATEWTLPADGTDTRALVTWSTHGEPFIAAIEHGPLTVTQFHPEKSGTAGLQLLRNWAATL